MSQKITAAQLGGRWFFTLNFKELAVMSDNEVTYRPAAEQLTPEQRAELDRMIEERKQGKGK